MYQNKPESYANEEQAPVRICIMNRSKDKGQTCMNHLFQDVKHGLCRDSITT